MKMSKTSIFYTGSLFCICSALLVATSADNGNESAAGTSQNETDAVALLDRLYQTDNRIRPGVFGGPTIVGIDVFVQSFGPLNEVDMEFSVDLELRLTWRDPRLAFTSYTNSNSPVYIPPEDIKEFWIPDIYFPNEKSGSSHQITIPNKSLRIYKNGTIRYLNRMAMDLSCTMDLKTFPLDSQTCEIKISTYSYESQEIELKWYDEDPIELKEEELNLPQFELMNTSTGVCNETYKTGEYSCLKAIFKLKRKVGFFVLQSYVPSILIVMLSWVGFWINKNSEPARVTLGVTTVLTMTTQLTSSRSATMKVSYLKAIDVWYSACMIFVFGAIIEFAFVNISVRNERKVTDKVDLEGQESKENHEVRSSARLQRLSRQLRRLVDSVKSKNIDMTSRRVFPAAFLIFNIIYFIVYALI